MRVYVVTKCVSIHGQVTGQLGYIAQREWGGSFRQMLKTEGISADMNAINLIYILGSWKTFNSSKYSGF